MNIYKLLALVFIFTLYGCFASNKIVTYCGKQYVEKPTKVYLSDEDIESNMIQVINRKNKKLAFGYYVSAIRNDTNFIFSKLSINNDTIINLTYHRYKITKGIDSSVSKYICTDNGILFHTYQTYWNGVIKKKEQYDRLIDND